MDEPNLCKQTNNEAVFYLIVKCNLPFWLHCKCFDHKNYRDWKLRGPCRENLHYLWKRAVRIVGFPRNSPHIHGKCRFSLQGPRNFQSS